MNYQLKKLRDQVIVITGASSGIGLVTARMAAERGAKLVLASRNERALAKLAGEINDKGGDAIYVAADVAKEADVKKIASEAVNHYGTFDTWVNNAGVSIYGKLEEVSLEDSKQLFETNFWGLVNGSIVAARHLRLTGGALINIGSTLSDVAIPLQGMYSASKHAVKGFTDALRMELEADGAPVSVTLIKPAAIDTPYKEHAKNYLGVQPENPPPVYSPETAARAILHSAEHSTRDVFIGGGAKVFSTMRKYAPRTTDIVMENTMIDMQKTDRPDNGISREGLYESQDASLKERGGYTGHVAESSLYTKATLHPKLTTAAVALGLGGLIWGLTRNNGEASRAAAPALRDENGKSASQQAGFTSPSVRDFTA